VTAHREIWGGTCLAKTIKHRRRRAVCQRTPPTSDETERLLQCSLATLRDSRLSGLSLSMVILRCSPYEAQLSRLTRNELLCRLLENHFPASAPLKKCRAAEGGLHP
jgi:hypothetical protein